MFLLKKYMFPLCLSLCMLGAACRHDNKNEDSAASIVLAAVFDTTGDQASMGLPSYRGAQLAIDQVNAKGGINDHQIKLVVRDYPGDQDALAALIPEMLAEYPQIAAFLGLSDTDRVLAAGKSAAAQGKIFLTSGATSPKLPEQIPDNLFMGCFGDNVQAAAAAEFAYDHLHARTVAVLYDTTELYTQLLREYFTSRFTELGGQVVSEQAFAQGNPLPAVAGIAPADFVYFAAFPVDAGVGAQEIRKAGITVPIVGGDTYDEPGVWQAHTNLQDIYFTTHAYLGADNPDPQVQAFRQAYMGAYQDAPTAFSGLGYDAARLMIDALQQTKDHTTGSLIAALENIKDFPGITGSISFTAGSHIPHKSVTIMQVRDGEQQLVKQFIPRGVPKP